MSQNPAQHNTRGTPSGTPGPAQARPWLGVRFVCGGTYLRVYRNAKDPGYVARCPRCAECVRFTVAPGGTSARLYDVDCGRRHR
ncbi:MAG: hypothetical protein AAF297_02370 [Planctomycetota bacterium]